jgi:hypothetical protein
MFSLVTKALLVNVLLIPTFLMQPPVQRALAQEPASTDASPASGMDPLPSLGPVTSAPVLPPTASPSPASPAPESPLPAPRPRPLPPPRPREVPEEILPAQERLRAPDILQEPQEVFQPQEVRPLPGQLDAVPVFNSNSPEVVLTEGILLSTFPPNGMRVSTAHLNYLFNGRFDFFSHHISRARTASETRTLFQGVLVYNPSSQPVRIEVLQGASYLTRPDALFVDLPAVVEDPLGKVYAGPGSRAMNDILRGRRQGIWLPFVVVPPGQSQMLMNLPIPAGTVTPVSNGRSTLLRLRSSGPVYMANLAMFAPLTADGGERSPSREEWQDLLVRSDVAGPRDQPPTPLDANFARIIYGRVAGVAVGSEWRAALTDTAKADRLTIPRKGQAFSYGLSTLVRGTLGTGQVQSAKLLVRYPDTAYQAHGNYGIQYSLTLPLQNPTKQTQTVAISVQTPLKEDRSKGGLLFFKPPPENRTFFRGPVRVRYVDDQGVPQNRVVHLIMQRGQEGEPLVTLNLKRGEQRMVQVDLLYPPDSTPPQVLTVRNVSAP